MINMRCNVQMENIPSCLRQRPQWVCWRYILRNGQLTKKPFNARIGVPADSTDPATWSSFEEALTAFKTNQLYAGIGFVFAADDPYCGVDLDDCIDRDTGLLKPWAQQIVDSLASYCEISPSGWGIKIFLLAKKPGPRCRTGYSGGEVEIYDQDRFFTVTGRAYEDLTWEVSQRQEALEQVYQQVFGEVQRSDAVPVASPANYPACPSFDDDNAPRPPVPSFGDDDEEPDDPNPDTASEADQSTCVSLTDEQILHKAMNSRKSGSKFTDLWEGRWNNHFNSASEADSSLVFTLAFYTKDAAQIDRIFRRSKLKRAKWDEQHGAKTYGQMTIDKALSKVKGQWKPKSQRKKSTSSSEALDWQPQHLSQQINAERLVHLLDGNARYNVDRGLWMWFDGRRYAEGHDGQVDRLAKQVGRQTWHFVEQGLAGIDPADVARHALDSEKASGVAAMMKLARSEPGIAARTASFDADRHLFNCLSGTLDLEAGCLRPHSRDDLLAKLAHTTYDPAAARPLFDSFMRRIMGDDQEMVAYLQRVLGRCLGGDVCEQAIYFFIGEGANGKSVLIDTILAILGDYAGTAPESLLTVQAHNEHPAEIADLCGKRLVVASETEEGARLKIQLVKRLTGDAILKGRFMRQDFFAFPRTRKLIVVSNNRPLIRETKHAIWRRIRLVPFDTIIPPAERDPQLTQKLNKEWPGILAWLLEGYLAWRQGGMQTPQRVLAATQSYQSEQDPIGEYLHDRCVLGIASDRVARNDLFNDYLSWCHPTSEKFPLSRNALFDHIRGSPGVSEGQWRIAGVTAPTRGFTGIRLT